MAEWETFHRTLRRSAARLIRCGRRLCELWQRFWVEIGYVVDQTTRSTEVISLHLLASRNTLPMALHSRIKTIRITRNHRALGLYQLMLYRPCYAFFIVVLVSWFSEKSLTLLPPDVRFHGWNAPNSISDGTSTHTPMGNLQRFLTGFQGFYFWGEREEKKLRREEGGVKEEAKGRVGEEERKGKGWKRKPSAIISHPSSSFGFLEICLSEWAASHQR